MVRALFHGESQQQVSRHHLRQQGTLQGLVATQPQGRGAQHGAGQQGGYGKLAPDLLEQHTGPLKTEIQTPVGFRHQDARPAQLDHGLPQVVIEAALVTPIPQRAQGGNGRPLGEKAPGRALQHLLLFR